MRVYMMLPFVVLEIDTEHAKYEATLVDDYVGRFDDVKYTYPIGSEIMRKHTHYAGITGWIYTMMLPQEFGLYEGGE